MKFDDNKYYKIILIGKRQFEIDESKILEFLNSRNIIRIKNDTDIKHDIEGIASQNSLKGLFAKKILEKIKKSESNEISKQLLDAFEIGMDILSR